MNTTNLFVELVVIGVGVSLWLLLLVGSAFGYAWVALDQALLVASAVPALALTYVFGIVWDRVSDSLFERWWADDLRASFFPERGAYYDARRVILSKSPPLAELLEYGRSRLRICRGWTLNAVMVAGSLNLLLWIQYRDVEAVGAISLVGTFASVAMAGGSWYAWRSLAQAEYRKIKEQSAYLRGADGKCA